MHSWRDFSTALRACSRSWCTSSNKCCSRSGSIAFFSEFFNPQAWGESIGQKPSGRAVQPNDAKASRASNISSRRLSRPLRLRSIRAFDAEQGRSVAGVVRRRCRGDFGSAIGLPLGHVSVLCRLVRARFVTFVPRVACAAWFPPSRACINSSLSSTTLLGSCSVETSSAISRHGLSGCNWP